MIVTINTDASFRRDIKKGGYAFWIVSNSGTFCRSGMLRKKIKTPSIAEMMCIINSIDSLGKLGWNYIHKIIINTDSMDSKYIIETHKKFIRRYHLQYLLPYGDKFRDITRKYNLHGIQIEVRHVPSHVSTETPRQYCNEWCDKEAKKHLNNYIQKIKNPQR